MIVIAIVAILAISALMWFLRIPTPEGFANPFLLRLGMAVLKVMNVYVRLRECFTDPCEIIKTSRGLKKTPRAPVGSNVKVSDLTLAGVRVLHFVPDGFESAENRGVVYFHGGGWCNGDVDLYSSLCQDLAQRSNSVFLSVNYRLAPEHPYPAGFNDCLAVTKYFLKNAKEFYVDSTRIAIQGDSAGATLAAAVALKLRDINFQPQPKLQVLAYPALQAIDFLTPSYQANSDNGLLPSRKMAMFWIVYALGKCKHLSAMLSNKHAPRSLTQGLARFRLQHEAILNSYTGNRGYTKPAGAVSDNTESIWAELETVFTDPYFAPLMATDVTGVPECVMLTAEMDVLRDDGIWYAEYLKHAGVKVSHVHYKAGLHGMMTSINQVNFKEFRQLVIDSINTKL